jgi:hypothetical protein
MDITYEKSIFASTNPTGTPYITETPYIEPFLAFNGLEDRLGNDPQGFYERKQYDHDTKFPILVTQPITMNDNEALKFKPRDIYFQDPAYEIEPVQNMQWISNTELQNLLNNVFSDGVPRYASKSGPNPEHDREKYMLSLQRLDEILANPDPTIANAIGASSQRASLLNKIKLADPTFYMTIQSGENEKRMLDLQREMVNLNSNMLTNAIATDDVNSFIVDVNNFINKYVDQEEVPEDVLYRFEKVDTQLQKFLSDPTLSKAQKERLMQLGNGLRSVLTSNIFKERELQEQEYLAKIREERSAELKEVAEMRKVEDIVQMHEDLLSNASLSSDPTYKKMRDEHVAELREYAKVAKGVEKSIVKEMLNELLTKPKVSPVSPPVEEKIAEMPSPTEESMASAVSEMTIEPAESKEPEFMPAVREEYAKVEQKFTDVVNLFEDLEGKNLGTGGNRLNRYAALTNLMERLGVPDEDMVNIWDTITSLKSTKARHNKILQIIENTELDKAKYDKLRGQEKVMFKSREFAKTKLVDLIVKYLNVK